MPVYYRVIVTYLLTHVTLFLIPIRPRSEFTHKAYSLQLLNLRALPLNPNTELPNYDVPQRRSPKVPVSLDTDKVPVSLDTLFRNTLLRPLRGNEMSVRGV